jgi:tetratricopeptide (TPR) repeat protein
MNLGRRKARLSNWRFAIAWMIWATCSFELGANVPAFADNDFAACQEGRPDACERMIESTTRQIESGAVNSDVYFHRGVGLLHKGDYDRAITDLNRAIAINPRFGAAYNQLGEAYRKKGELGKALASYTSAISVIEPSNPVGLMFAYYYRGQLLESLKRNDDAIADYRKAYAEVVLTLKMDPSTIPFIVDALKRLGATP